MTSRPEKRALATQLLAETKLSIDEVAAKVGCSPRTLNYWKLDPEFQEALKLARNAWRARANQGGLADLDFTLRNLQDRHKRLRAIIEHRAKDPQLRQAPGGRTGLYTVTYKMRSMGEGLGSETVAEYSIDVAMLQEMREIEVQIQTHLGTWKQKVEHTHTVDVTRLMGLINAGRERVAEEKARRTLQRAATLQIEAVPGPPSLVNSK